MSIVKFIEETKDEIKKISWAGKDTVVRGVILVVIAVIIVSAFVFGVDQLFGFATQLLFSE